MQIHTITLKRQKLKNRDTTLQAKNIPITYISADKYERNFAQRESTLIWFTRMF